VRLHTPIFGIPEAALGLVAEAKALFLVGIDFVFAASGDVCNRSILSIADGSGTLQFSQRSGPGGFVTTCR